MSGTDVDYEKLFVIDEEVDVRGAKARTFAVIPPSSLWQNWVAHIQLWQIVRLVGAAPRQSTAWGWALLILMASNRQLRLLWPTHCSAGWVKVSEGLIPGVGLPKHRNTKRAALILLKKAGLVDVRHHGSKATQIRLRDISEAAPKAKAR